MKKQLVAFVCIILLTILSSMAATLHFQGAEALENVDGTITSDTLWTLASSPYHVETDVTIASGVTLTIEPGVEVIFESGSSLVVNGSLYAVGTNGDRISFTSSSTKPVAGDWNGIKFYGDENSILTMNFCVLRYATNGTTIRSLGRATIEKSTIINNSQSGIHVVDMADLLIRDNTIKLNINGISSSGITCSRLKMIGNKISDNENGIHLYTYGDNSRVYNITISDNTLKDNTKGIYLHSSARPGFSANAYINNMTISHNLMESNQYGIYLLAEGWGEPGLMGGGAYIYNSMISDNAISFSENAIYIDSTSNWYSWISGITISGNTIHSSKNGIFMHSFRTPQPLFQEVPFDVTLIGNTISANSKGVSVFGDARANFTANSVSYNSYGIYLVSSVTTENVARNNDIYHNTVYGICIVESATIDAERNYWGASSGPYHETLNPAGEGDNVNGNGGDLVFAPFSPESFGPMNNAPFAVLQGDKTTVAVNQTVILDGSESYDDSSIIGYFLDFGDGTSTYSLTGVSRHRYVSPGMYNASLVVQDDLGVNSTNKAIQAIIVIYPSLVVSVFLNPPSTLSQAQITVQVHVSDGEVDIQEALVRLSSDNGGNFESSLGHTDSEGYFTSIYFAPSVSQPINARITATASKEGYSDGSRDAYLSVLTPSSDGASLDYPLLLLVVLAVMVFVSALVQRKRKLRNDANLKRTRVLHYPPKANCFSD